MAQVRMCAELAGLTDTPVFYTSISHFLVLFGYKLFSLYYPLFLESRGFDLASIGGMYLLLYGGMGITSPLVRKILIGKNPARFLPVGIAGYALYSIGMIFSTTKLQFYLWQLFLGISAATFYMSARSIIMESRSVSYDRDFAYFYSAPLYSTFLAPLIGGVILWKYDFAHIFMLSIFIYIIAVVFAIREGKGMGKTLRKEAMMAQALTRILKVSRNLYILVLAFIALISVGIHRGFFVLFLENELGFSYEKIIVWIAASSFISIPLSWEIARFVEKRESEKNIAIGNSLSGVMALLIALCYNVYALFVLYVSEYAAKLISESGKSGFLTKVFKREEESGAMLDTMLTSFGVAVGALVGGMVAHAFGLRTVFLINGAILLWSAAVFRILMRRN